MRRFALVSLLAVAGVLISVALASAGQARPRLYLLSDSGRTLVPVSLNASEGTPARAVGVLVSRAQLRARRLSSPFPSGTNLIGLAVRGGTATVALRGHALASLRTIPRLRVIASVTWTLTSFPGIVRTRFEVDGRPWGVYDHHGRIIRQYERGAWLPACAPGDGCFAP
jgi:hypothetical protein